MIEAKLQSTDTGESLSPRSQTDLDLNPSCHFLNGYRVTRQS